MSVTFVAFVLAFSIEAYQSDVLLYGLTPAARVILVLPLFGVVLVVVTLIATAAAWRGWGGSGNRPYWSLVRRMHYALLAVAGVAFIWWLGDWNLLGFRF